MGPPEAARRLVVNADDFGRSPAINQAVILAHRNGILTTASLMVNEPACAEAVALARENPGLGVGLHLSLVCGRAALKPDRIPKLADQNGNFSDAPVRSGLKYFFQRSLRESISREIDAQFEKFRATGLPLDHVNGHLNLHLHPVVFEILVSKVKQWEIRHMRLTYDPFRLSSRLARGRWIYRALHAIIYHRLSARARPVLRSLNVRHTGAVFGLLQDGRVDEAYLCALLPHLPPGDCEVYSHPSTGDRKAELDALVSPRVKSLIAGLNIQLIRYRDIP